MTNSAFGSTFHTRRSKINCSLLFGIVTFFSSRDEIGQVKMPSPFPGAHAVVSRARMAQMNERASLLRAGAKAAAENVSTVLVLGELSLLPVLAAAEVPGDVRVLAAEPNPQVRS